MLISVEIDPDKEYIESIRNNLFNSKHRFCKSTGSPMKTKIVLKNRIKKAYDIVSIDIDTVICAYPMENSFKIVITKFLEALLKHIYENNKPFSYRAYRKVSDYLSIEYEFSDEYDYKSRNVLVRLLTDIFNYLLLDVNAFELLKKIPIVPVLMVKGTIRNRDEYCEELNNSVLLSTQREPQTRHILPCYQINVKNVLSDLELFFEEKHYLICFMSELITYILTNNTVTMIESNMNYLLLATSYRSERISKRSKTSELSDEVPDLCPSADTMSDNVSIAYGEPEKSSKHLYVIYKFIKIILNSLEIVIQGIYLQKMTCNSNRFGLFYEPKYNFIYDGWSPFGEQVTLHLRPTSVETGRPHILIGKPCNNTNRRIVVTIDVNDQITIKEYGERQYRYGGLSWLWMGLFYLDVEKKYTCNNFEYFKSYTRHNVRFNISSPIDKSAEESHKKDRNLVHSQHKNFHKAVNQNWNKNSYFKKGRY